VRPSDINFSLVNSLYTVMGQQYVNTYTNGTIVSVIATLPNISLAVTNSIALECFCDLGAVPNTYSGTSVSFNLTSSTY
jgi:hypothetical protein